MSYGMRVFKHNLKTLLAPFCKEESQIVLEFDWDTQEIPHEFVDNAYSAFIMTYFNDLKLLKKPQLSHYFEVNNINDGDSKWCMELYKFMINDTNKYGSYEMDYMHTASYYEQYEHVNNIINVYYGYNGCDLDGKFIDYINTNEFSDCAVNENLFAITAFDDTFPVDLQLFDVKTFMDQRKYIFYFVEYCYRYGCVPKVECLVLFYMFYIFGYLYLIKLFCYVQI